MYEVERVTTNTRMK